VIRFYDKMESFSHILEWVLKRLSSHQRHRRKALNEKTRDMQSWSTHDCEYYHHNSERGPYEMMLLLEALNLSLRTISADSVLQPTLMYEMLLHSTAPLESPPVIPFSTE
jgi:hypothetical protein